MSIGRGLCRIRRAGGIGKQPLSRKRTAPRAAFGTADRVKGQMALAPGYKAPSQSGALNPGPGAYKHRSGVGVQSDAKKPSAARYSFGKQKRGARGEVARCDPAPLRNQAKRFDFAAAHAPLLARSCCTPEAAGAWATGGAHARRVAC